MNTTQSTNTMNTKFFTNQQQNTLFNKFTGIFEHNQTINNFDILIGYFRSSGYFKLRPSLENVDNIRILVGIDVDKITRDMQAKGLALFNGDREMTIENWQGDFKKDINNAEYKAEIDEGILQFIDDVHNKKVTLKAHPSKKIHAKIYIFRPDNFNEHNGGSVITGSANLTKSGLGITTAPNYEFNVLLNDYDDVAFATAEFERLWGEGVDILPAMVNSEGTHLADITPYELYLKCLIEYFGDEIEFDPATIKDLPQGFKRLSYQLDAVNQGWEMLKKHNGFFLADVVGLGKTLIAVLIARQFFYANGYPDHRSKILLVIPPALRQNWQDTIEKFKMDDAFTIITNGSLHKIEKPEKYDMVIVDEAHKFRNDTSDAYNNLQKICKTKTTTKTKECEFKKVILVSATPLNNRPSDIYNQILLFKDGNGSTLDFNLSSFFTQAKKDYKDIITLTDTNKAAEETKELYDEIRTKVITPLMVRRTRTDLLANKSYKQDLAEQGIVFPKTTPPQPIYYQLEQELESLYDRTIQKIDNKNHDETGLLHTRYQALKYLMPEFKQNYKRPDSISAQLVGLMKTLLLKRMDSSFYAFTETLGRFIDYSNIMIKMIDANKIVIAPNLNINDYVLNDEMDELMEFLAKESLTDPNIAIYKCDDFEAGFVIGVRHDCEMLKQLKKDWDAIIKNHTDPKVEELLKQLPHFLSRDKNPEGKIIIFTESVDTLNYLNDKMTADYGGQILAISSGNRDMLKQIIEHNFDANINAQDKKNDYQIIITSDVLAEGINLHRANAVINYDTPWNATKLMQRIGRVNRIGQMAKYIFVYNFYPTSQINDEIGLQNRAIIKLQAFHSALGEDSQIYSTDEDINTFGIFDENFQEAKNEIMPFLDEIRQFRANDPAGYKRIKDLPSKMRNTVDNSEHKNGTLVFARTKDRGSSRFYLVKDTVENYGFINAAKQLKCTPDTPLPAMQTLPEEHYLHVHRALKRFTDEIDENMTVRNQNQNLSVQKNTAIKFLKAMRALPDANDDDKAKLSQAITTIQRETFQELPRKINILKTDVNKHKNTADAKTLENCLNIIAKFDVNKHTESTDIKSKPKDNKPSVVISQFYS